MPETGAAVVAALVPVAGAVVTPVTGPVVVPVVVPVAALVVAPVAGALEVVAAPAADEVVLDEAPAGAAGAACRLTMSWWARGMPWALTSSRESEAAKRADSAEIGSMVAGSRRKVAEGATRNATCRTEV